MRLNILSSGLLDPIGTSRVKDIFKTQQSSTYEKMSKWRCRQTFALLAAQRLVNSGIQLRKQYVGALLKAVKKICELDIKHIMTLVRVCTL